MNRTRRGTLTSVQKRDVNRLQQEIEDLFSEMWQVSGFAGMRRGFRPHVDCYRTEEPPAVVVVVDLAGVDPAGAEARYEQGLLTIVMPLAQTPRAGKVTIAVGEKK